MTTKNIAIETANQLLKIKAIKLNLDKPYSWASGWNSPIYCDNRITLSYVPIRNFIRESLTALIEFKYGKPDVIAGVATGAIAIGALVAQELGVPFVYVRPEAKKHGRQNQIEGHLENGQNVVVVEDLISTGKSSINAVKALKNANVNVKGMVAIFTYGFDIASENFNKESVELNTLSDYNTLLHEALSANYITEKDLDTLQEWRKNPSEWNKD
jgi:orotate phosphoribosyltransferase